ncbi:MAG TPA: Ig-like domain-containing protein [Methylophilus sp.]
MHQLLNDTHTTAKTATASLTWGGNNTRLRKITASVLMLSLLTVEIPSMHSVVAANVDPSLWVTVPVKADPMLQGLTIPANAVSKGMWSSVNSWPLNGLHAAVLPDGKVLTYGSPAGDAANQNGRYFDLWDPTLGFGSNSHQTTYRAQQQDSFCSTSTYMNDGRLLISGGNGGKTSTLYTPATNSVTTPSYNLALDRWYATMINLPDGRPLMLGCMVPYREDMVNDPNLAVAQGLASMTPEVLESTGWRSLFGAYSREAFGPDYLRTSFPRAFVAPNGQIFGISADKMWYLDANDNGSIRIAGNFKGPYSATTPVNVGSTNNAVMFAPGKILVTGGNGGWVSDELAASNMATVVDINGADPVLTEQPRMVNPRRLANATVLANGQVVVTGGTTYGNLNGANAVYAAEIWDANTGTWTTAASAAVFRGYHSNVALLPNGTLLSTGGGAPGPVSNLNAEIYYPPYLFSSSNGVSSLAARPVIKAISGLSYSHNAPLQLDMATSDTISQLVLIGISKGTHAFNSGQRRIPLTFSQESYRLTTTTPNAFIAPPGYYQVVALNANGVPSLGTIVAIGQDVAPPPVSTTPYNPPDVSEPINAPVINAGATANYTVTAATGTTYSWNFGDGSADTPYSSDPAASHTYAQPGLYVVTLSAKAANGDIARRTFLQAIATSKTALKPNSASPILLETRAGSSNRIWTVNPDNDTVGVVDTVSKTLVASINVGTSPRSIAMAPDGRIWVTNKTAATISVLSPATLTVVQTIALPRASQPHGLVFAPDGSSALVVLEATGQLLKLNPSTGAQLGVVAVGAHPRHLAINADSSNVLVSRFITPPLVGEATAAIDTSNAGAEVVVVNPAAMSVTKTMTLQHSDKADTENQGSGIPNYLAAAVISPDGTTAWLPSKQDNIKRGMLRNSQALNFQNTVRAISSRINLGTLTEDYAKRLDHDNASVASAAVYHPSGVYMFVALETSRQVAVVDAIGGRELFRLEVGRAPQGLAISADGNTLYVHEFMDRSVSMFDLTPLTSQGQLRATLTGIVYSISAEKLPAQVVLGKQLFYDARDSRLARDSYMSCATCHSDGGHDGRVWDLTGFGEGLRNTVALNGRAGMGHGFLHWSANFDEVQDFEKQIRELAGGTGLMSDAQYSTGTRNQALGDPKAGISMDLDDLATYLASLNTFAASPHRNADASLTAAASAGKALFQSNSCASCHAGNRFTVSADATQLKNIGTIKASSGKRLGGTLPGIDVPTLRDVWATAPYLHDGSAPTLNAAILAHHGLSLNVTDVANLVAYTQQIGSEEVVVSPNAAPTISLTAPVMNANYALGTVVTLTASALDSDGSISKVEFYDGATLIGSDLVAPYSINWANANMGAHSITAKAYDNLNATTSSAVVNINVFSINTSPLFGAPGGTAFTDPVAPNQVLTGVIVNAGWWLDGIQGLATPSNLPAHGGTGGTAYTATWPTGEYLVRIYGQWGSGGAVAKISFATNTGRVFGPYGIANGIGTLTNFDYTVPTGNRVLGFAGRADVYLNAIGVVYGPVSAATNQAPTVSLTGPINNTSFTQGTAITLTAIAADSDGTVSKVEFYDGATLLGTDTTAPYAYSWSNAAVGVHSLSAKAYDNANAVSTSAVSNVTVNAVQPPTNSAPSVSLTSPTNGTSYTQGSTITLAASASDSDGTVSKVEFYVGATLLGTDTTAPYAYSWSNAAVGAHSLTAKAYDNNNAVTTSAASNVTVNAVTQPSNAAPTVSLTSPSNGASFSLGSAITLSASANDSDGSISKVEFYDGTLLLGTDTTAPYSMSWTNGKVGGHTLTAKAYDNANAATTSAAISITIKKQGRR